MATPKTPRKRAVKVESSVDDAKTLGNAEDIATNPPADLRSENPIIEDAEVILDQPEPMPAEANVDDTEAEIEISDQSASEPEARPETSTDAPSEPPAAPEPSPHAEPDAIAAAPTVVKTSPGFVPLVLGGVVAAGLGFALARYVVPEGWPVPGATPLQSQLTQQAEEIKTLRAALQALPQDDDTQALTDELDAIRATAATALETAEAARNAIADAPAPVAGEDFTPRIAALEDRLTALESRPAETAGADPAIVSRLTADIAALRKGLDDQKAAAEALVQQAEASRADTAAKAQSVLLQAALTKVEAAMQSGEPFAEPLTLLGNAGLTVPAVLSETAENGLPTDAALATSFADPARAALEESLRGNMGDSWSERVSSFLRSQTGARSLTPKEGNDPDAILSRANAAVTSGDLQTALTEIATLPETAQTALSTWVAQAKQRLDAQAATVELATALSER